MEPRNYESGASESAPIAPETPSVGYPTAGNPGTGTPATKPGPFWFHAVSEEIRNVILATGQVPDDNELNQMAKGIGYQMPFRGMAVYETTGTFIWNVPEGVSKAYVVVTGAGGGGAYRNPEGGSGGGGGGSGEGIVDVAGLESVTVTVGAGGAGGASSPSNGSPGGSSSFGSFISATGGEGGKSTFPLSYTPGGMATGGDVNNEGQGGSRSFTSGDALPIGGYGGGPGGGPAASSGRDASVSGSGGGGSVNIDAGNGADGIVIIRW